MDINRENSKGCVPNHQLSQDEPPHCTTQHNTNKKKGTLPHLRVLEIVTPQWPDFVLASNVPYSETNILILHSLDIETCEGKDWN